MVNGIRTVYRCGLNKTFGSKFCLGSQVQHEASEEGWRKHWQKHCECDNKDKENNPNTLNDKTYQDSSQKFLQILFFHFLFFLH